MLQFLDINCGDDNFREAFSAYISRNEETTNRLTEKAKRLKTQLLNAKTEQEITDNQLSAAFQEVESLKVTLKIKNTQIRKLTQDRSQLKDELTAMKKPMLATVVSKLFNAPDKATPDPSGDASATNPKTVTDKTNETADAGKRHELLTSESNEDLRRMLDGYYSPSPAAGNSSDDPGPSRTTKLHIVLPKDDGYLQEDKGDQSSRNFFSLLESKEFQYEAGQSGSLLQGVKPGTDTAPHLIPTGHYEKAWVDAIPHNVVHAQQIQDYDSASEFIQPGKETERREKRKTARHLAIEWTGNARRHNLRSQADSKKSVVGDAGNRMRLYLERHFGQQQTSPIEVTCRNSTMGGDVSGAQSDVRAAHDDVIAGQHSVTVAKRVGHSVVIVNKSSRQNDVIGDVDRHVTAQESEFNRGTARILGNSTSEITVSQTNEPRKLRHNDVTAADGYQHSTDVAFHGVRRIAAPHSGTRLDCDILKAVHVTSRQYCDNQTANATCRWASFGVSGRPRAPTDMKCLNCSGVEKVVRSRAGLRSAEVSCDDHGHKLPSYVRNYSTTYAWQTPNKTDASDLLQITRLDRK